MTDDVRAAAERFSGWEERNAAQMARGHYERAYEFLIPDVFRLARAYLAASPSDSAPDGNAFAAEYHRGQAKEQYGLADLAVAFEAGKVCQRRAASQADDADGWRPIETAGDDDRGLFWLDWSDDCAALNGPLPVDSNRIYMGKNGTWCSLYKATHWRPLPDPPKVGEAAKG